MVSYCKPLGTDDLSPVRKIFIERPEDSAVKAGNIQRTKKYTNTYESK